MDPPVAPGAGLCSGILWGSCAPPNFSALFFSPSPSPEALSPPLRSSIVHLSLYLASSEHTVCFWLFASASMAA